MGVRVRTILVALVAMLLLVVPAMGAAVTMILNPVTEQVVEGHTVFTTIQPIGFSTTETRFAAAVAVLVREFNTSASYSRFPGVLWFNDQYLVKPGVSGAPNINILYPCGAVLAVRAGDPDPRTATFDNTTYSESYMITDPNNAVWNVDKWIVNSSPIWTVALGGKDVSYGIDDDQHSCGSTTGQGFTYNAVLYFKLEDLVVSGAKDHSVASTDVNGCQPGVYNYQSNSYQWPCPGNDDDKEGNSHPYNPGTNYMPGPAFSQNSTGRGNHGGSASCSGDSQPDFACHATANVDIYYGAAAKPFVRNYVLIDTQGSTAPYYCEPSMTTCNSQEWNDQHLHDGGSSGLPVVG